MLFMRLLVFLCFKARVLGLNEIKDYIRLGAIKGFNHGGLFIKQGPVMLIMKVGRRGVFGREI